MNKSPVGNSAADTTDRAILAVLDGRAESAVEALRRLQRADPDNVTAQLELACALAVAHREAEAEQILQAFDSADLAARDSARLHTAAGYLCLRRGDTREGARHLKTACDLDPSFPLANYSYGQLLLFRDRIPESAITHLKRAADEVPESKLANFGVVATETERGRYGEAWRLSLAAARRFPGNAKVWVALADAAVLASPAGGRLVVGGSALLLFLPYLGPVVFGLWLVLAGASITLLRRVIPRYAVFPLVALVPLGLVAALRVLLLGRAFP